MSNLIHVDSNAQPVASVCVFQADRAEVRREMTVTLKAGQNEVSVESLPDAIDSDTIRVEGMGNAVIFDVIYHPPPPLDWQARSTNESINAKEKDLAGLKREMQLLDDQKKLLEDYAKSLNAEKADPAKLAEFLTAYKDRRSTIHKGRQDLQKRIEACEKDLEATKKDLQQAVVDMKRTVKVTVVVLVDGDGDAHLSLWYVVSGASWTPTYDVRATISKDPKQPSAIALGYQAYIKQNTGEDWTDIALTLSTASPELGTDIPTLLPYQIGPEYQYQPMTKSRSAGFGSVKRRKRASESSPQMAMIMMAGEPMMAQATAIAVEGALSSTFVISGKSNIPSDDQTHKVSIATIDLQAQLEWIAVPRIQPSVFLRCKVKNTSQYALLGGSSSVFLDGNYVCKSWLPTVSPSEKFTTSLGVDPGLKVTYHPLQKKGKSQGGILATKTLVENFGQRISIKNNRSLNASPVYVKDHIPTSEDSDIKVTLLDPKDLGIPKERRVVVAADKAKARWAFHGQEDEGEQDAGVPEEGTIEWICDVPAGDTVNLTLSYSISAPADNPWVRL